MESNGILKMDWKQLLLKDGKVDEQDFKKSERCPLAGCKSPSLPCLQINNRYNSSFTMFLWYSLPISTDGNVLATVQMTW